MAHGTFATTINCMDGRTQLCVNEFMRKQFGVDFVDTITEPGPLKYLSSDADNSVVEQIKLRVEISANKHGSKHIGIVGHDDCAGNPVDRETQMLQIEKAVALVSAWVPDCEVFGIYVEGKNWTAQRV